MRSTFRWLAIILVLFATTATHAWAAGERDVTIAQGIDAEFLDVQMTNNIVTLIINGAIYDTLLTRDKQLQIVPRLATSYRGVSDKVWEVKLRSGVKFHNGEPFDATAVKFSFERINRRGLQVAPEGLVRHHRPGRDRRSPHRALPHQGAGPGHACAHDPDVPDGPEVRGPGGRRAGQPQAGGDGAVPVRRVDQERARSWSRPTTSTGRASRQCAGPPGGRSPSWAPASPPSRPARPI